jgi:hypothetical protein
VSLPVLPFPLVPVSPSCSAPCPPLCSPLPSALPPVRWAPCVPPGVPPPTLRLGRPFEVAHPISALCSVLKSDNRALRAFFEDPVKRKRALLESNPPRDSRMESHPFPMPEKTPGGLGGRPPARVPAASSYGQPGKGGSQEPLPRLAVSSPRLSLCCGRGALPWCAAPLLVING